MEWGAALEDRYRERVRVETSTAYRLLTSLGAVLFLLGTGLDWFSQRGSFPKLIVIRLSISAIFALLYLGQKRGIYPSRNMFVSGLVMVIFACASITAMCMVLDGYKSRYYAGNDLVLLAAGVLLPWSAKEMAVVVGSVWGIYYAGVLSMAGFHIDRPDLLANNSFFFIDTGIIAVAAAWFGNKLRREAFFQLVTTEEAQAKLKVYDDLKTRFFANISHELRTPLTLILGPTAKMLRQPSLSAEMRTDLQLVDRNARMLLNHVNDLLEVARLESGKIEVRYSKTDAAELIRTIGSYFEPLAAERKIRFAIEVAESVPAEIDVEKVQRIALNLLSNAFKFVPPGGIVRCVVEAKAERLQLTVSDSGPGIAPHLRQRIFERFFQVEESATRKFGGTGLGLAIVRELVEVQHGTIAVDRAEEGGARFIVELPLHAPSGLDVAARVTDLSSPIATSIRDALLAPAQISSSAAQISAASPTWMEKSLVLVVEDHRDMNRYVCEALGASYRTVSAFNGREGLEKALTEKPDLIVTDVMMPEMSGADLVRQLKRDNHSNVPIIVLTAKIDDELRTLLLQGGAQDYLAKPFSAAELRARVGNLVSAKRTRDILQRELDTNRDDLESLTREIVERQEALTGALGESREARAVAERALGLRDDFIAVASHELRTPLTSLKLQIDRFKRKYSDSAKLAECSTEDLSRLVRTVERQSDRLWRQIEEILDVARIDAGILVLRRKQIELGPLVREVIDALSEQLKASGCHIRASVGEVRGIWDPDRLEQVVVNLMLNAIKYGGGNAIDVAVSAENGRAHIVIEDHGMGIAPENQKRIFERFERAVPAIHISGFGLGLYIVRTIVEAHGGSIAVKSELGSGAKFTVELPIGTVEAARSIAQA